MSLVRNASASRVLPALHPAVLLLLYIATLFDHRFGEGAASTKSKPGFVKPDLAGIGALPSCIASA